jgi:hypothetical protein
VKRKTILYELNEVPFRVLDGFCARFPQSFLASKLPHCHQYETVCEDTGHLSPWITWPSLHRGVNNEVHLIHDFGQDLQEPDRCYPPVWKILTRQNVRVGVCGSLHSYPLPPVMDNYAFYLADTFALTPESFPEWLTPFQEFNLSMARESARNVSKSVPVRSALKVLSKAATIGLRLKTFASIGGQLADELLHRWRATRRRTFQSVLQFDVFMNLLNSTRPDFATFFTNHAASAMHRYWAAAFPDDFERNEYDDGWIARYRYEIEFAMQWADRFFGDLVRFVEIHPEYVLWVATSMGQEALIAVPLLSQLYVSELDRFMRCFGVEPGFWSSRPAMLPTINIFVSPPFAGAFEEALRKLRIEDKPLVFSREPDGFFVLHFGQKNLHNGPKIAKLGERAVPFAELGLKCEDIEDQTDSSGYHVNKGMLLVYDPAAERPQNSHRPQVSTLEIAPAILRNYSLPVPTYMKPVLSLNGY